MIALGWVSVALALVLLFAEAHLPTRGVSGGVALVALVCGVVLLLIGATAGVLAVLAVSLGVSVAWVGALVLLARSLRPSRRLPRSGTDTSTPAPAPAPACPSEHRYDRRPMDAQMLVDRSWPALRRILGAHTRVYRLTRGLVGHRFPGAPPMLLLDHMGARSEVQRTTLLGSAPSARSRW